MKKIYVAPQVELMAVMIDKHLCADSSRRVLQPDARWGSNLPESEHGNASWVNEGYSTGTSEWSGIGAAIPVGDDDGNMNNRAHKGLWED